MGKGDAADADVSAVGTLVWVRRPNGSWWPGRVVAPHEVPDSCPPPPRSPGTPILLLGRRDGPGFVDWCNLQRCKRVKPFRCGERDLEDCIRKAQERGRTVCATAGGRRYARKEDAVLQALDIERATLRLRTTTKPLGSRKRRTPNDCEGDAPQRMKDLTDIGVAPNKTTSTFADLNRHLPSTSQMKRSKQAHHHDPSAAAKTKQQQQQQPRPSADQDQPCGFPRKRDRSRPLSELCNGGDAWKNGLNKPPNGRRPDQRFMRAASTLDTVMVTSSSRRAIAPVKMEPVDDAFPCGGAHLAARSIFKADHLYVHQPCASTKAPTQECTKRALNCSKDGGIPSQYDSRNCKKKTTSSVAHEGGNRIKIETGCEHPNGKVATHKAASNGVVLLVKRVEKTTTVAADKAAAPDAYKDLAMIPNGLNHVDAVGLQRHSERKCKLEEPSETIRNCTELENVPAPSVVFEPPHQVLPAQQRDPVVGRCLAAVKPVKTLQLNSPSIYNVEVSAQGGGSSSSKGGRVPLVSLMSKSSRRPVVGYPASVEVLDDTTARPPAPVIPDDHPSTSNSTANRPMKEEEPTAAAPRRATPPSSSSHRGVPATRAKAKSRRKASEDESWRPHTKNDHPAASSSPRKMRRLSSFASGQSGGDRRPAVRADMGELCRGRGPALACVPLRLVFSRIHEALTYSGR